MNGPRKSPGRVVLLGAGPGAPDLITLRGVNALRAADAVVYDALASPALLDWVPPGALRHNVGKRGHDAPTLPQEEINALVLKLARAGKTVVRLKGGDPFVFGRGGEEATACAEAGVDFEVIPGISAAVGALAFAGIPLTDRRYSASFAVVTGHKDPTKVAEATRWEALAGAVDTLVVVMGMRNLADIVARLLAGGRDPQTPAAVVMNGTTPKQRVLVAPLGELPERARVDGFAAPAVIVVGNVVRLRESLAWFEGRPLFGKRVLVTRDEGPDGRLTQALREAGAEPVAAPMIRLVPPADWRPVDEALDAIGRYDAILVTSANAIRFVASRAEARGVALTTIPWKVMCVGPKTADAARALGWRVDLIPERQFDAEGLLRAITAEQSPHGRRFFFPCAEGARDILPEGLAALGATVDRVSVYRTLAPEEPAESLRALLLEPGVDALTFTSPSCVENFAAALDEESRVAAGRCIVACIGPVTAEALRKAGMGPDVTAERAGIADLVAALAARCEADAGGNA